MMRKSNIGFACVALFGMITLALVPSVTAFGPGVVVTGNYGKCAECVGCPACCSGIGLGCPHCMYGVGFPGGGVAHGNFGRRAVPAPVYFANTYPEYLYGSPNIYAGFDEYDTDVAFVSPVVGKTPFHYDYHNDQYNHTPYYGKRWEKNWYVTDQVAYRAGGARSTAGTAAAANSYGNASANEFSVTDSAKNTVPAPEATPAAVPAQNTQTDAAADADEHVSQMSYMTSPHEDAYRGRFIYNFESFCDDDPPCPLLRPIACLARALFGCGSYCVSYGTNYGSTCGLAGIGYCCEAYSGHGGYGGFNCPGYRSGGCGKPFIDPFVGGYGAGYPVAGDCCGGIYVDSYSDYDGGIFVDANACTSQDWRVDSTIEQPAADESETVSTEDDSKLNDAEEVSGDETPEAPAENGASLIPQENKATEPAEPTPGSVRPTDQPTIPQIQPEDDDAFRGLFDPVSGRTKPNEGMTVGSIQMNVPENAVVIINGYRTKLTGTSRTFLAKNLVPGEVYPFEIKVLIEKDGNIFSGVKETELRAGDNAQVAFSPRDFRRETELTYASK
jgi:uncharacterized protein (TIGR03000 family)